MDLSDIDIANERLGIVEALKLVGTNVPDFGSGNMKLYCPFGDIFHPDEGHSKAMRVYPATESAHCFAGCGTFTPVRLIALQKDLPDMDAAEWILEQTGYVRPDYNSRWEALMSAGEDVDRDALTDALKVACQRMDPNWEVRQFEDEVSISLRKCLQLLRKVHTGEDASRWLSVAKRVMARELGATQ